MKKIILIILTCLMLTGCEKVELKNIELEAGTELPTDINYYLQTNVSNSNKYTLDVSNVDISKNGTYDYYIKRLWNKYTGKITIKDTQEPYVEIKNIYKEKDEELNLNDFIVYYKDVSDEYKITLNYDNISEEKLHKIGNIKVSINIEDINGNSVERVSNIIILPNGALSQIRKDSMIPVYHDSENRKISVDEFKEHYLIKFSKPINISDKYSVLNITKEELNAIIDNKYKDKEHSYELISLKNELGQTIGLVLEVSYKQNNKNMVDYLHYDDIKKSN